MPQAKQQDLETFRVALPISAVSPRIELLAFSDQNFNPRDFMPRLAKGQTLLAGSCKVQFFVEGQDALGQYESNVTKVFTLELPAARATKLIPRDPDTGWTVAIAGAARPATVCARVIEAYPAPDTVIYVDICGGRDED